MMEYSISLGQMRARASFLKGTLRDRPDPIRESVAVLPACGGTLVERACVALMGSRAESINLTSPSSSSSSGAFFVGVDWPAATAVQGAAAEAEMVSGFDSFMVYFFGLDMTHKAAGTVCTG